MEQELFDFDTEGMTDEELEEMMDSLTLELAQQIEEDESRTSVLNMRRVKEMQFAYQVMQKLAKQNHAELSYKFNEPFTSMGSISVTGKDVVVKNLLWFLNAAKFASNVEVYPKTDGKICMTLTFHGLTEAIE